MLICQPKGPPSRNLLCSICAHLPFSLNSKSTLPVFGTANPHTPLSACLAVSLKGAQEEEGGPCPSTCVHLVCGSMPDTAAPASSLCAPAVAMDTAASIVSPHSRDSSVPFWVSQPSSENEPLVLNSRAGNTWLGFCFCFSAGAFCVLHDHVVG